MPLYVIGTILILSSVTLLISAYIRHFKNIKESKKENGSWSSPIPLIGSLLFICGYFTLPIEFSYWSFLIILADIDSLLLIIVLPFCFFKNRSGDTDV